jgi:uncharacterized protein
MDRITPTTRPARRAQGFQRWHRLLFSHWEMPEAALRALVPERLSLDAFEGRYFVGVVSFTMKNVRPFLWAPSIPTATDFGEINLRTYVHIEGREPGVFFFSLDAASTLVVRVARAFWGLPYYRADIEIQDSQPDISYACQRGALAFRAEARIGEALPTPEPDSLEYFLCERYQFYAEHNGRLRRARVHHQPYPLHSIEHASIDSTLLTAAGLPDTNIRTPNWFSPGVDVEVFSMEDV